MNAKWKNPRFFGWSYSKQNTWDTCKKQFYYTYIGKHEPAPLGKEVRELQKLRKFNFIKGDIVHLSIANFITGVRKGVIKTQSEINSYAMDELRPIISNAKHTISEEYNGFPIDKDRFENLQGEVKFQINNFFTQIWPSYSDHDILYIDGDEGVASWFDCGGCKVWVKPDLVTIYEGDHYLVTDWKAGDEKWGDDPEESLQLSAYVLWACRKYELTPDLVSAEFIYLRDPSNQPTKRSIVALEKFTAFVKDKVTVILDINEEDQLPPNPSFKNCRDCNYATICQSGKEILKSV